MIKYLVFWKRDRWLTWLFKYSWAELRLAHVCVTVWIKKRAKIIQKLSYLHSADFSSFYGLTRFWTERKKTWKGMENLVTLLMLNCHCAAYNVRGDQDLAQALLKYQLVRKQSAVSPLSLPVSLLVAGKQNSIRVAEASASNE